jgi:hypothetical protein
MPISLDEFRKPRFNRFKERYPFVEDKNFRMTATMVGSKLFQGRFNSNDGSGWKTPGYNPNHDSINTERVNLRAESPSYKPY